MVDVWIPWGMTHINRGNLSSRTLEEAADGKVAHILENKINFKRRQQ
jgi:hypothetical protein